MQQLKLRSILWLGIFLFGLTFGGHALRAQTDLRTTRCVVPDWQSVAPETVFTLDRLSQYRHYIYDFANILKPKTRNTMFIELCKRHIPADRVAIVILPSWKPRMIRLPESGKNTKPDFDGFVASLFSQLGYDQHPDSLLIVHDVRGEQVAVLAGAQMMQRIGLAIETLQETHYQSDALARMPNISHIRALMQLLGAIGGKETLVDTDNLVSNAPTGQSADQVIGTIAPADPEKPEPALGQTGLGTLPGPGVYDPADILRTKERWMIQHFINSRSRERILLATIPDYRIWGVDPAQMVQVDLDFAAFADHAARQWQMDGDGFGVLILFDVASQSLELRTGNGFFEQESEMLHTIWRLRAYDLGYGTTPDYRFFQDAMYLTILNFTDAGEDWRRYMLDHDPGGAPKVWPSPRNLPLYPVSPARKYSDWKKRLMAGAIGMGFLLVLIAVIIVRRWGTPEHKEQSERKKRISMWKKHHR